jgi:hypothetical protein
MNLKKYFAIIASFAAIIAPLGLATIQSASAAALSIKASTNTSTSNTVFVSTASTIAKIQNTSNTEITNRINSLTALQSRVDQMVRISASDKQSLDSSIHASLQTMTALKATIDADTDLTTLKAGAQSITKSYRVYALVLPQGRVEALADRVLDIVSLMNTLAPKLQARITADQSVGQNVSAAQIAYTDMQTKISDATTQANAATTEVAGLTPDNGNQTIMQSNTAALKDAISKLKVAQSDLKTARADISTIIKTLISLEKTSASASASTSASTSAQ